MIENQNQFLDDDNYTEDIDPALEAVLTKEATKKSTGFPQALPTDESALAFQVGGEHYKKYKIQPIEYITANNIPYSEGNIIKYATRWRDKGGKQDLLKIKHIVDLIIDMENL